MKVFLVIYMLGKIGGTVGPLPYGMNECMAEALKLNQQAQNVIETGIGADGRKLTEDEMRKIKSMDFKCEYHAIRPENNYP